MRRPTISLLLANYNHAQYLERALSQLLSQTEAPLEVILVDDGSTDSSLEVIAAVAEREPLLRVVRHERNLGVCAAYNRALAEARGDYVYLFAADDHVEPTLVARTTAILAEHPGAALCCWDPAGLDDATGQVLPDPRGWSAEPAFYTAARVPTLLGRRTDLTGAVAIYRRAELAAVGNLRPELRWLSDWFATLAMALRSGFCYVPAPLAAFRIRKGSYCQRGHRDWAGQWATIQVMMDLLASPDFADVREPFRRLGALRVTGWRGLCLMLCHRRCWPWITRSLVRGVAVDCVLHVKATLFPYLPAPLLAAYRRLVKLWRRPPKG